LGYIQKQKQKLKSNKSIDEGWRVESVYGM